MDPGYISNEVAVALLKLAKRYHVTWAVSEDRDNPSFSVIKGLATVKDGNQTVFKKLELCYKAFRKELFESLEDLQYSSDVYYQKWATQALNSSQLIKNIPMEMNLQAISEEMVSNVYFNGEVKGYYFPITLVYMLVWKALIDTPIEKEKINHIFLFVRQLSLNISSFTTCRNYMVFLLNKIHPDVNLIRGFSVELDAHLLRNIYAKISYFLTSQSAKKQALIESIWLCLESQSEDIGELLALLEVDVLTLRNDFLRLYGISPEHYLEPINLQLSHIYIPEYKQLSEALYSINMLIHIRDNMKSKGIKEVNNLIEMLIQNIKQSKDSLFLPDMQFKVIRLHRLLICYYDVYRHQPEEGDAGIDLKGLDFDALESKLIKLLAKLYCYNIYPWSLERKGLVVLTTNRSAIWETITLAEEKAFFIQKLCETRSYPPGSNSSALAWLALSFIHNKYTFLKAHWFFLLKAVQQTKQQSIFIKSLCSPFHSGEDRHITPLYYLLSTETGRNVFVEHWSDIVEMVKATEQQEIFIQALCSIQPNKRKGEASALYHFVEAGYELPMLSDFWAEIWGMVTEQLPLFLQALFHIVEYDGLDVHAQEKGTSIFFWFATTPYGQELLLKHDAALLEAIETTGQQAAFIQALCHIAKDSDCIDYSALCCLARYSVGRQLLAKHGASLRAAARTTGQLGLFVNALCHVVEDCFEDAIEGYASTLYWLIRNFEENSLLVTHVADIWDAVEFTNQEQSFVKALCKIPNDKMASGISILAQTTESQIWLASRLPDIWVSIKGNYNAVTLIRDAFLHDPKIVKQLLNSQLNLTPHEKVKIRHCLDEIQGLVPQHKVAMATCNSHHELASIKVRCLKKIEQLIQKQEWSDFASSRYYNFFAPPDYLIKLVRLVKEKPKTYHQYFQQFANIIDGISSLESESLPLDVVVIYRLLRVQLAEIRQHEQEVSMRGMTVNAACRVKQ